MVLEKSKEKLKNGDTAPNFNLLGTDGKSYTLSSLKGKAILIIFMCNHCPYVNAKLQEMCRIAEDFNEKGLVVVGINSNDSENYPEDSFEKMREEVSSGRVNFLYLIDENQDVAKAYGASCTPDPFLFDEKFKLVFHSRIDYPSGLEEAEKHEMYDAIKEFLKSGIISLTQYPSMGCSIKWKV
jgi:peroxiredoxin